MAIRKFEFRDNSTSKFWHIDRKGKQQTVWFGRIDTTGQTRTKLFASVELAKKSVEKLIAQKLNKGYIELGVQATAKAKTPKAAVTGRKSKAVTKKAAKKTSRGSRGGFSKKEFAGFFEPLKGKRSKATPKMTSALAKKAEKSLGITLPATMVELLKIQNGGYLSQPYFSFKRKPYELEEIWPIRSNGGIEALVPEYSDHLGMASGRLNKPEFIFPFCGDGHFFFALDYRETGVQKEPQVIYLDIEGRIRCRKLADSFDDFLAGWQRPDTSGKKKIDIESVDPKSIIGRFNQKKVMKHSPKIQHRHSNWICLQNGSLDYYQQWQTYKKRRNGEWSDEFHWERWVKESIPVKEIRSLSRKKSGVIFVNYPMDPPVVKAPEVLQKLEQMKNSVTILRMERDGPEKNWKNKPKTRSHVIRMEVRRTEVESCARKIKAAARKAHR